jgi:cell division protein ZapA
LIFNFLGAGFQRVGEKMGKERLVEIKVFGQTYTVKSEAEENHIQAVAQYVNEKMDEVLKKTRSVSTLNVAILTALNIADDLLQERRERMALIREVETKSKDLAEKIEIKMGGKELEKISITG